MAHNEPSHQDLHCLSFCFIFLADLPICNNGFVQIKDGRIYFRNSGVKGLNIDHIDSEAARVLLSAGI